MIDTLYNIVNNIKFQNNNCVIFDIDDTLINSKTNQKNNEIIKFYKYLILQKINIILITARTASPEIIKYTYNQLNNLGIKNYKYLYFITNNFKNVKFYKINARKDVHNKGYNIIMSLGDNEWDYGKYGGIGVLIKNDKIGKIINIK
jgi:predicted secreted acid phosphatase